ncbi:MAG: hypothetical protein OQK12_03125 [Motiliproteus sp.]|nr:hypothetical protein [Motiliproteus sp.]MCW9053517.1 hypothetical protein [Motiliproteus sp.]
MMIYLLAYMAVGVLLLTLFRQIARRKGECDEPLMVHKLLCGGREDLSIAEHIKEASSELFAMTMLATLWPLLLVWKAIDSVTGQRVREVAPPPVFKVEYSDLIEKLTVHQVEQRERVQDPMKAVPDVPFGHLNSGWRSFIDGMQPTQELWYFSAQWDRSHRQELRTGYALVKDDEICSHYLSDVRRLG